MSVLPARNLPGWGGAGGVDKGGMH